MRALSRPSRGVSLPELLAVLCIVAALLAAATPAFRPTLARARLASSVHSMLVALHFARSTAILRGLPTAVCLSADGERCLASSAPDARGWLVFHDLARSTPVQIDAPDRLLRRFELPDEVTLSGSRAALTYWPVSRAGTTGTFLFCHADRPGEGRAVIVSRTGRPRTATDGSWTSRLSCAR